MLTASFKKVALSTPTISKISPVQSDYDRKVRLLRLFCLLSGMAHTVGISTLVVMTLLTQQALLLVGPAGSLIALTCFGLSYWLGGNHQYRLGGWLLAWANTISIAVYAWLLTTQVTVLLAFFIPIGMAIILMEVWETALVTLACCLSSFIQYLMEVYLKGYTVPIKLDREIQAIPNIVLATIILPIIVVLLVIPAKGLAQAMVLLQIQSGHLQAALGQIEARFNSSQQISQHVFSLATELNVTASQQASGSQEQAVAVSQTRTSVSELSLAAANIDMLADQVNHAAYVVAQDSQQIGQTTDLSVSSSEKGLEWIGRTVEISQEVAQLYQEFVTMLAEWRTQNTQMRLILEMIGTIAAETHLLSLNAAIEAAGAGEYGDRFRIVAQEVKNLATRSASSSQEVVGIVRQIEKSANMAEISAKAGLAKAEEMAIIANQAGGVIEEMGLVAQQAQTQANKINQTVQEVRGLTEPIKIATMQQHTASLQVLEALDGLKIVASQSAQSSSIISEAVLNLEDLAQQLTTNVAA